jgi:hypothetical protein
VLRAAENIELINAFFFSSYLLHVERGIDRVLHAPADGCHGEVVGLGRLVEEAVMRAATCQSHCGKSTSKQNKHPQDVSSRYSRSSTHPSGSCEGQQKQPQSNGCGIPLKLV